MRKFHIHVDAQFLSPADGKMLIDRFGFEENNFTGHPANIIHFEPNQHYTFKCTNGQEFDKTFRATQQFLARTDMRGYLEGEYIPTDLDITPGPFNPEVPLSLKIGLTQLPPDSFRATELHVVLDKDRSDPCLIEHLCQTGLYGAYLPKSYGTALVLTAQGSRVLVGEVLRVLTIYLQAAGGGVNCSIKEERIIRWWKSHPDIPLPPVVNSLG